jgi:predicted Zn-dependent protease
MTMPRYDSLQDAARIQLQRTQAYLQADPDNPSLLSAAIDQALAAGLPETAASLIDASLQRDPANALMRARMGDVLLAQRRWSEAAAWFDELLSEDPDAALAFGAAYARLSLGRHRDALALLLPYADQAGLHQRVATLLVRLLHGSGDASRALEVALRHLDTAAGDTALIALASLAAFDSNQLAQARSLADAALTGPERPAEALVTAASLALGQMDVDAAERLINEVLRERPEEGRAWSALGVAALMRRDFPTARANLETALRYIPDHIGTRLCLGWSRLFSDDRAGAAEEFAAALALDRNVGESHGAMAVALALAGRHEESKHSVDRALGLDPSSLSARYAEMVLNGQTEDPQRFLRLAQRLLRSRENDFGQRLSDLVAWDEAEAASK